MTTCHNAFLVYFLRFYYPHIFAGKPTSSGDEVKVQRCNPTTLQEKNTTTTHSQTIFATEATFTS
jgi:hypothetical protein